MSEILKGREVIVEFYSLAGNVKVSAIDVATMTEVSIVGPASAGQYTLKANALKKLEYMLKKKGILA